MRTILVVDDERDMRALVELHLHKSGYNVLHAENGSAALEIIRTSPVDLVLLDVMMPGKNGFEVCEEMRKFSSVPIIFLTALDAKVDLVKGLVLGGDDYVIKPFTAMELTARMDAIFRRVGVTSSSEIVTKGVITNNFAARKVTIEGKKVSLTLKEFELIHLFMSHEAMVFSREQLLERLWGLEYEGGTRTVDTHIKTLRIKLGAVAGKYIETVWGIGYRFEVKK